MELFTGNFTYLGPIFGPSPLVLGDYGFALSRWTRQRLFCVAAQSNARVAVPSARHADVDGDVS